MFYVLSFFSISSETVYENWNESLFHSFQFNPHPVFLILISLLSFRFLLFVSREGKTERDEVWVLVQFCFICWWKIGFVIRVYGCFGDWVSMLRSMLI